MSQQSQNQNELSEAAGRVRSRICLVTFLEYLKASWWIAGLTTLLSVIAVRLLADWRGGSFWLAAGLLGGWLLIGGIHTLLRRPSPMGALSIWDERGGWKDLFSSAWFFAGKPEIEAGEGWHVGRALKALPEASRSIGKVFPIPKIAWAVVMVLLVLAFAKSPILISKLAAGDTELTDEMLAEAERQAEALERENEEVDKIEGLDREEREELRKIQETTEGAADELADSEGKTTREVLEALEGRARAAEKLAEKLGAASDEWASEEMLREMSQHADSADLAAAIKDKKAENAAVEADTLAKMLDHPDLKLETRDRVTAALSQTMEKATEGDRKKPVGERVGNASRKMDAKQPRTAAREFEELAKHFKLVKKREEAQEKLQKLADKLRDAGSSISGSKLQKMQQLASSQAGKNVPKGTRPLSRNPLQNQPGAMPMNQNPGQQGNQGQMPIPGPQSPQGQGQQQGQGGLAMPVPGTGQKGKQMGMAAGQPGGKGGQKGAGLFAPIPGQAPGAGGAPGAGLGGAGAAAGANGGLQAGSGTAGLGNQSTEAMKATQDAKITAQINDDGESTFRAVQGQAHREQSQLERQQIIVDFIKVEEEALDEKALPMSRREHVTRYLSTLREKFEETPKD